MCLVMASMVDMSNLFYIFVGQIKKLRLKVMEEIIAKMNEQIAILSENLQKAPQVKAAAARARKASLELEKLGKEFRKISVAASK